MAANVVLGSGGQRERKGQPARRLGSRRNSLDRVMQLVDAAGGIVVFDGSANGTGFGNALDRERRTPRVRAVAVLQIDRHG